MNRPFKQVIYGIIYLVFFGAIIFLIGRSFFAPAPGCNNGIKDSKEEGVDCGKVCGNICLPPDMRPLEKVGNIEIFHPTATTVSVLSKVQNANNDLVADSFDYTFKLFDANNVLLASDPGTSFIYAGEIKYLVDFFDLPDPSQVAKAELTISNPHWRTAQNYSKPDLLVQSHEEKIDGNYINANGKIFDQDTLDYPKVTIFALFKDGAGENVGVSKTEIENLKIGESRSFSIIHPVIQSVDLLQTEYFIVANKS